MKPDIAFEPTQFDALFCTTIHKRKHVIALLRSVTTHHHHITIFISCSADGGGLVGLGGWLEKPVSTDKGFAQGIRSLSGKSRSTYRCGQASKAGGQSSPISKAVLGKIHSTHTTKYTKVLSI